MGARILHARVQLLNRNMNDRRRVVFWWKYGDSLNFTLIFGRKREMTANRMRGMPLLEVATFYSRVARWYKSRFREGKINRAIYNQSLRVFELFSIQCSVYSRKSKFLAHSWFLKQNWRHNRVMFTVWDGTWELKRWHFHVIANLYGRIDFEPSRSFANIPHGAINNMRQVTASRVWYFVELVFRNFCFHFLSRPVTFRDRNRRTGNQIQSPSYKERFIVS